MNLTNDFPDILWQGMSTNESDVHDNNGTGSDVVTNTPEGEVSPLDEWSTPGGVPKNLLVNNIAASSLSLIAVLAHIPVLVVLQRCRRMKTSFKLLAINFVLCSLLYFASIVVVTILFLSLNEAYTQPFHELRVLYVCSLYASSICTVGGLALERYVRIIYPLMSTQILQTRYIIAYIIGAWSLGFLTIVVVIMSQCDLKLSTCNISQALYINRYIFFTIFSGFSIVICISCLKISKVINSKQTVPQNQSVTPPERADSSLNTVQEPSHPLPQNLKNTFKATRYIMKIMLSYVICHVPFLINTSIFIAFPKLKTTNIVSTLQMVSFVCSLISFFISTHFFIWKFKECKLVFLQLFCSWNPRLSAKTRDLKMDVYNIPMTSADESSSTRPRAFPE